MTRNRVFTRTFLGAAVAAGLAAPSLAQFNNQWLSLNDETTTRLPGGAFSVSDINNEVDLDWADLNQDGFTDLVVVRKEPFTSTGRRTNILLMNEGGVLVDRTALYASAADIGGDNGFLTPTNDRDVIIADLNNDGWLDFVTATTLSDGLPKSIGHPRVYMNLGNDGGGNWLGMRYEESRFPQMVSFSTGNPENPRFCSVAIGDVTGDGFADLYFGDYDSSGAGGSGQPAGKDLNDRLMVNDGNGFFTDQSQLRMTSQMLASAFGNSVEIADYNQDGFNDILKDTSLNAPQYVAISYNNPSNPGFFSVFDDFHFNAPYHTSNGDLNNDGRIDVIISDDATDRIRINTGVDAFGRVIWSSAKQFNFLTGGDDGFASNNLVADLDGDGWEDALIADVDVDIGGYGRRLHIYHNITTTVGTQNVVLREERQSSSSSGWIGAVGLTTSTLTGTHDVAVFDIENDGDNDLIIARKDGTQVYTNGTPAPICGFTNYGPTSGANVLSMNGSGTLKGGTAAVLTTTGINAPSAFHVLATAQASVPLAGGTVLVNQSTQFIPMQTIAAPGGTSVWSVNVPSNPAWVGLSGFVQAAAFDAGQPGGFAFSNGVQMVICP